MVFNVVRGGKRKKKKEEEKKKTCLKDSFCSVYLCGVNF